MSDEHARREAEERHSEELERQRMEAVVSEEEAEADRIERVNAVIDADPTEIYLQPRNLMDGPDDDRHWAPDDPWDHEDGIPATPYMRADLAWFEYQRGVRSGRSDGDQQRKDMLAQIEEHKAAFLAEVKRNTALSQALEQFLDLVGESAGVYGFHLNGDLSPWSECEDIIEEAQAALAMKTGDPS